MQGKRPSGFGAAVDSAILNHTVLLICEGKEKMGRLVRETVNLLRLVHCLGFKQENQFVMTFCQYK